MPILSGNPMWEAFGLRALPHALYGGTDLGECITTVEPVGDDGTADDWYRGGHCESLARGLYHQRVFDWLDETLQIA